mgnify:CR=1 FL=1
MTDKYGWRGLSALACALLAGGLSAQEPAKAETKPAKEEKEKKK